MSFWQDLLRTVTLKVTDYFCKGTPTKVVMLYLKTSCFLYGGISLTYPIIRAGLEYDNENSFGKLFLEFQWDSFGSTSSYIFLIINSLVVIFYFWRYRSDDVVEAINKILHRTKNIEQQNEQLLSNDRNMGEQLNEILLKLGGTLSSIKTLLPNLKESINSLKVKTASDYLNTIWDEVQIHNQEDNSLQATILYLQGECARFAKDGNSKSYHERAYQLMKKVGKIDEQILTGVIYEACRSRDYTQADIYSKELKSIAPDNYWAYVSELMQADNLTEAIKMLPASVDCEEVLATCIMLGGGKNNDLGVDIVSYQYHFLDIITIENFALWIMDLSIAMTRFCYSFMIQKNVKEMYTPQCEDLYKLLDKFLTELKKTEIDNPLPDTVFLHAATGYFSNQNKSWLAAFTAFKPSKTMEEIYALTYAILLNDVGNYNKAKELLNQYVGDNLVSILNMRFVLAINHNDSLECIEILKCACENKVSIPDHFAHCFFTIAYNLYDSVKGYVHNLCFESEIAKAAFSLLLDFKNGNKVDTEFILQHKTDFPYSIAPYMAIIVKENGNLSDAIEVLEFVADHKVLDIRTYLLIEYYQFDKSYSQKLYHLLFELREAGQMDLTTLSLELNISNQIRDYENSFSITSELIKQVPDDINVWVEHVLSLYRCGKYESEIIELKKKFVNTVLPTQATIILFNVYHAVNETLFALDLLYDQIIRTQDQNLKDFLVTIHINPEIDKLISVEKESIECGDLVTLYYDGKKRECVVSKGSVYEELVGCRLGEKKEIIIKTPVLIEIQAIHTKYFKLLRDIFKDISENQGSRNIKMFSTNDFDFSTDPMGSLLKMAGKTDDVIAKEKALLAQYQKGEITLFNFINDHEWISDIYEKIFGQQFMLCSIPVNSLKEIFVENEGWKQKDIALDLTSLVSLYEFDRKYGLKYEKKFYLPKSLTLLIKEQLLNEEKGMPKFISQHIVDKLGYDIIDENKTILWNKLKSLERWIEIHCCVETVEEIINMNLSQNDSQVWREEVESLLLTRRGMLILTEDWCLQKRFLNLFPTLSVYQWLTLMEIQDADTWGQFMLECGNVGYPVESEYIRAQYDLMSNNNPNNYQTCLKNVQYNPESILSGIEVAKSLIGGIIEPSKIVSATNMLSVMFSSVTPEISVLLIKKELISNKNSTWRQCLIDALRISHPLAIIK